MGTVNLSPNLPNYWEISLLEEAEKVGAQMCTFRARRRRLLLLPVVLAYRYFVKLLPKLSCG